jgi:hypothetical protein
MIMLLVMDFIQNLLPSQEISSKLIVNFMVNWTQKFSRPLNFLDNLSLIGSTIIIQFKPVSIGTLLKTVSCILVILMIYGQWVYNSNKISSLKNFSQFALDLALIIFSKPSYFGTGSDILQTSSFYSVREMPD